MRCPATTGWLEVVFRPAGSKSDGVASRLLSKLADLVLPVLGCSTESCFHGMLQVGAARQNPFP